MLGWTTEATVVPHQCLLLLLLPVMVCCHSHRDFKEPPAAPLLTLSLSLTCASRENARKNQMVLISPLVHELVQAEHAVLCGEAASVTQSFDNSGSMPRSR